VELECRGELLRAWWTDPDRTQEVIEEEVTEHMRGGFTLRVTYVRENRVCLSERIVDVPWTNKQLTIKWERFGSLLEPGREEVWTAVITGPDAGKAVAEMVAGMYDASLDQLYQRKMAIPFQNQNGQRGDDIAATRKYYLAVRSEDMVSVNKVLNNILAKTKDD